MKIIYILIVVILANLSLFSQNTKKWKEISKEDFAINSFDDKISSALILNETISYSFNEIDGQYCLNYEIFKKIKINDEKGLKYGTFTIDVNRNENIESITKIQAYTYIYENGEIKTYKLNNSDIKTSKISKQKYKTTVKMPELKAGAIIVYRYSVTSFDIVKPIKIFVQSEIPRLNCSVDFSIPDFLKYQININEGKYLISNNIEENNTAQNYNFHLSSINVDKRTENENGNLTSVVFYIKMKDYIFKMNNIPAISEEGQVDNYDNYKESIEFILINVGINYQLKSEIEEFAWVKFTKNIFYFAEKNYPLMKKIGSSYSKLPYAFYVFYNNDWKEFDGFLISSLFFGKQMDKIWDNNFENDLLTNTNNIDNLQRMISIYDYVKKNYKWNGIYDVFMSKNFKRIAKIKSGNSTDINFVLISLLKKSGFTVYPLIIKTLDKGHIDEKLSTILQFNHTIACVKLDNKTYFLDATNPQNPWYILDSNDLNITGRIIDGEQSHFEQIIPNIKTTENNILNISIDDNSAKYSINTKYTGYYAFEKSKSYQNKFEITRKKFANISDFETSFGDLNNETGEFSANISFTTKDFENKNEIIPLNIFDIPLLFLSPSRESDIYFAYPFEKKYQIVLEIPKDKKIVSVPKSISDQIDGAQLSASINIEDNKIEINLELNIEKAIFSKMDYANLRQLFFDYYNFSNEPIVFE